MGDDDLGVYEDDVVFDWDGADTLASAFDDMADEIDAQIETRTGYVEHALSDGEGGWATLFLERATVGMNDAYELVPALRDAAEDVRAMKRAAEEEQQRREDARAWKEAHDEWENGRNMLEKGWDWVSGNNGDLPPMPDPPAPEPNLGGDPPEVDLREWSGVESSPTDDGDYIFAARPANMDDCATDCGTLDSTLGEKHGTLKTAKTNFLANNEWGTLSCDQLVRNAGSWVSANKEDSEFLTTAAEAFRQADQSGAALCRANAGDIYTALNDAGLWAYREDIQVQWSVATGGDVTTGFTNDPVSTASGNFYEPEVDLGFGSALRSLQLRRTYNSRDTSVGPFGTGWASWASARLTVSASGTMARLLTPDGAEVSIPLLAGTAPGFEGTVEGDGDGGLIARFPSEGACWRFDPEGRAIVLDNGPGQQVRLHWEGDRLVRMEHERGRWLRLEWDGRAERIAAAAADDGRRVTYTYDDQGCLVGVDGPAGPRRYEVDAKGLIVSVTDGDGVVLARNTYDAERRVVAQETPFGRRVRFWYRDGLVTEVDDDDGGPLNTWVHDDRGHLTRVVDGHGNQLTKLYDRSGNVVRVTDRRGAMTHYHWDEAGNCRRIEHPDGRTVELAWDDQRRCIAATGPDDATVRFTYQGGDRIPTTIEDAEGGVTRQEVVGGLVKKVVDADGIAVGFEHDRQGRVIAITDDAGNIRRCEWNELGQLVATVTPLGYRTEYGYDAGSQLVERRDPDGAITRVERSPAGRVTAVVGPDGSRRELRYGAHGQVAEDLDPQGGVTAFQWNQHGSVVGTVLPDGGKWSFERDALMQPVSVTDPSGATWVQEYDAEGDMVGTITPTGARRTVSVDELGAVRTVDDGVTSIGFEYDQAGRAVARLYPDGSRAECTYDRCGRIASVTEATGGVTRFEHSPAGRLVATVGPTGARTTYSYDEVGHLSEIGLATGGHQRLRHDADGRLVKVTGPCGETTRYTYDACDRPLTVTAPNGRITRYRYDVRGRVTSITDPTGAVTRYTYDVLDQVETVTDPNGGQLHFERDSMGRVVAETDPLGRRTTFAYDGLGRPLAVTDPLGRVTRYTYNADGRLVSQLDPDGTQRWWDRDASGTVTAWGAKSPGRPATEIRLGRDLLGRVTLLERDGEMTTRRWDPDGNLVAETTPWATMSWERDPRGHVLVATLDRAGHQPATVARQLDATGRPTVIDDPSLGPLQIERDHSGRVVKLEGDSVREERTWLDGQLATTTRQLGDQSAKRVHYLRDAAGRVTRQETGVDAVDYGYDAAGQLTTAHTDNGSWTLAWDAAGHLVHEDGPDGRRRYSYDAAGQLQSVASRHGTTRLTWDACGRRTGERGPGGERQYTWDSFGYLDTVRTTTFDGTSTTSHLSRDPLGRLAAVDGTPVCWDSTQPFGRPWAVGNRRLAAAGSVPLALANGSNGSAKVTWLGGDVDGQTEGSDSWGAATTGHERWPDAVTKSLQGLRLGYGGELALGHLSLLGHRAYDPTTRGFLSPDPLPGIAGHPWAANPYHYAGNDPIGWADPLGLQPVTAEELAQIRDTWNDNAFQRYEGYIVAAGLLVVGGAALLIPGVGPVVGGMIIGAAISGAISAGVQQATTGGVNYKQLAVDMAVGAAGGGAGGITAAATAGTRAVARYGIRAGVEMGVNTAGGMGSRYLMGQDPFDPSAIAFDVATGGLSAAGGEAFNAVRGLPLQRTATHYNDLNQGAPYGMHSNQHIWINDAAIARDGLDPNAVLRHESVHAGLSGQPGTALGNVQNRVHNALYSHSHLWRTVEEGVAQGYGTGSVRQGFDFANNMLSPNSSYNVNPARVGVEAGVVTGAGAAAEVGTITWLSDGNEVPAY